MADQVLAIDIGGTKIAAGLVDPRGSVQAQQETPTLAATDAETLFAALVRLCTAVIEQGSGAAGSLRGIGVGCGGPMQYPEGRVSPLNIPAWRDFPLRDRLAAHFGRPTVVDNDAKAYALGEYWIGGGQGARGFLGIVVSTGVGGGLVLDGKLVHGAHGNAGHIGHVIVFPNGPRCACGARGCVEAVASGPSMVRRARTALDRGRFTSLRVPDFTARHLEAAARTGDALAQRLFRDAGTALGRGIVAAASLLDLDRVVIGGGVSNAADLFWPALENELARNARLDFTRDLDVRISELRVSAALAGAAALIYLAQT